MKVLVPVIVTLLALAAAPPAAAQPIEIVVPGGDVVPPDAAPQPVYGDDYVYGTPAERLRDFDPAAYAINALRVSNFFPRRGHISLNADRAATLNATGQSLAEHQLRCQAAHPTYELASDTYIGPDGIPRPCRL